MTETERELLTVLAKLVLPHSADREVDWRNPQSVLRWRVKELLDQMSQSVAIELCETFFQVSLDDDSWRESSDTLGQ